MKGLGVSQTLKLLLVEDSENDALLILSALRKGGYSPLHKRVETAPEMRAALEESWDVIISDYVMPQFDGLKALRLYHERHLDIPFILASGHIGEETAVAAMKAGAHDYVNKENLARLVPAIERELREAEIRRERRQSQIALRENEERFRQLAENIGAVFFMSEEPSEESPGRISYVSPAYERVWGYSRRNLFSDARSWFKAVHPEDSVRVQAALPKIIRGGFDEQFRIVRFDMRTRWIHFRAFPVRNEQGQVYRVAAIAEDITERKEAGDQLEATARQLQNTVEELQVVQEELSARNDELTEARTDLEKRVVARTADLTKANAELERQIEERKRLENEILESTERERRRIGIDLHDDLGQHLNGIALMLKALENKLAKKHLNEAAEVEKIQSVVFATINRAHDVAQGLAAMDSQRGDLPQALTGLAAQVSDMFDIDCNFKAEGSIPPLPERSVTQFYKIAQESVTNAIKHGHAKQVEILLSTTNGTLTLTIKNDGLPMPQGSPASERMGLHIMRYRASLVGASLEVRANGKKGTLVTCQLSFKPKALDEDAAAKKRDRKPLAFAGLPS